MANYGIRLGAIAIIWFFSTAMLGLCIPLVAIAGSSLGILPLAVIAGATVGTAVVWGVPNGQPTNKPLLGNSIKQLDQRVANLEIICSSTEFESHNKIKQLESKDYSSFQLDAPQNGES